MSQRAGPDPRPHAAFTLVELLVVIGLVALLIGILLPVLGAARRAAQASRCAANLRQIGIAARLYANAYGDVLQYSVAAKANWIKVWQPRGQSNVLRLADPLDSTAYWGVAYLPFLASRTLVEAEGDPANGIVEFARKIWYCPSSNGMSRDYGVPDPTFPISYAINGYVTGSSAPRYRKLASYRVPSNVILAQDAVKTRLTGGVYAGASDTLSAWTSSNNLRDWRPPSGVAYLAGAHPDALREYYRHSRRSTVLWIDGHVSTIAESLGADVRQSNYTGK